MAISTAVKLKREERARQRRDQILDAARSCAIAYGFHGASISRICAEASIGVGYLYKFFQNKEAIIIALAERDFDEFMLHITRPADFGSLDADALIERYLKQVPWLFDHDRAALEQEILAEASRNPKMAELVALVDRRFRDAFREILEPMLKGLPDKEIQGRVETLLVMTRALALHASTHPNTDPGIVIAGYEVVLRAVLSPPDSAGPRVESEPAPKKHHA